MDEGNNVLSESQKSVMQEEETIAISSNMVFLIICLLIFAGSLIAGCVPLFLSVGKRAMSLMTSFGAGLLVSTALSVILPEGMEAFQHASKATGTMSVYQTCQDHFMLYRCHYCENQESAARPLSKLSKTDPEFIVLSSVLVFIQLSFVEAPCSL